MTSILKINKKDNVVVALKDLPKGMVIENLEILDDIPKGHKIALVDIAKEDKIIKYGMPSGYATIDISKGSHVHTHNVKTNLDDIENYQYTPEFTKINIAKPVRKINVYRRKNGDVGIRNELWIVPTVGCVNAVGDIIIERFKAQNDISLIDGLFKFGHPYGCSQMGDDHENTRITLQNIAKHPNAGGVLVLGLGCENNQIDIFRETLGDYDKDRIRFLNSQDVKDEISEGVKILTELFNIMKNDKREEVSISELKIGLKCGGSDGFSGITANPLLGEFSDYLTYYNGTTVLTEVPEMFGAERILMNRANNEMIFHKIVDLINDFKEYYKKHDQVIYENPSPGNKAGGITTLEDKSLGCTQKAGSSNVCDVLKHGETLKSRGLNLLSAPGNDLVATTALGAAGCHMVLFTTGRGTPFGGFVPTVKISTNSEIYEKKPNWIDFNAGKLLEGVSMDCLLDEFIDYLVEVANGRKTNNELNNFREIAIFKSGVTL